MRIHEVMTCDVVIARPDTPLKDVARLLSDHGFGGLPVVDEHNTVVGVISETDFVAKERGADFIPRGALDRLVGRTARDEARVAATTAGEAMSTPPITIDKRASVRGAAIAMLEHGINRLPVTDGGELVGIVTRGDLVNIFAEDDAVTVARLRESLRSVDGLIVEDVTDGVVSLAGTVASASLADAVVRVAASADGVIAVNRDHLAARQEAPPRPEPVEMA